MNLPENYVDGLYLFKALIKDGCKWQGDVQSKQWAECLYIPEGLEHQVVETLSPYEEGRDYKREGTRAIWIV